MYCLSYKEIFTKSMVTYKWFFSLYFVSLKGGILLSHILASFESTYILSARGPLAKMSSLDIMWVSFYSIAAMLIAALLVTATQKWIKNSFLSLIIRFIAFLLFIFGAILMVLVIFTWPS